MKIPTKRKRPIHFDCRVHLLVLSLLLVLLLNTGCFHFPTSAQHRQKVLFDAHPVTKSSGNRCAYHYLLHFHQPIHYANDRRRQFPEPMTVWQFDGWLVRRQTAPGLSASVG
jgi:hypothetical protein